MRKSRAGIGRWKLETEIYKPKIFKLRLRYLEENAVKQHFQYLRSH